MVLQMCLMLFWPAVYFTICVRHLRRFMAGWSRFGLTKLNSNTYNNIFSIKTNPGCSSSLFQSALMYKHTSTCSCIHTHAHARTHTHTDTHTQFPASVYILIHVYKRLNICVHAWRYICQKSSVLALYFIMVKFQALLANRTYCHQCHFQDHFQLMRGCSKMEDMIVDVLVSASSVV